LGASQAHVADRDTHRTDKRGRVEDNASGGWQSGAVYWKRGEPEDTSGKYPNQLFYLSTFRKKKEGFFVLHSS